MKNILQKFSLFWPLFNEHVLALLVGNVSFLKFGAYTDTPVSRLLQPVPGTGSVVSSQVPSHVPCLEGYIGKRALYCQTAAESRLKIRGILD